MPRVFELLASNPAKLLGVDTGALVEGYEADIALVEPEAPWFVDRTRMEATADNTPFDRQGVQGRVRALFKGGVQI